MHLKCMKMKQRDNRIFALRLEKLHGKQFFEVPIRLLGGFLWVFR